jgi:hypothetical protein
MPVSVDAREVEVPKGKVPEITDRVVGRGAASRHRLEESSQTFGVHLDPPP